MALTLSTVQKVADHLGIEYNSSDPNVDLTDALDAARVLIEKRVSTDLFDATDPPAPLHRAALLLTAEMYRRTPTVAGVDDSFQDVGSYFMYDKQIRDLLFSFMAPQVGGADLDYD